MDSRSYPHHKSWYCKKNMFNFNKGGIDVVPYHVITVHLRSEEHTSELQSRE